MGTEGRDQDPFLQGPHEFGLATKMKVLCEMNGPQTFLRGTPLKSCTRLSENLNLIFLHKEVIKMLTGPQISL